MAQTLSTLLLVAGFAIASPTDIKRRDTDCTQTSSTADDFNCGYFTWGSIGDSWCSGVAYSNEVAWDGNANSCMRVNHAYSAQLIQDTTWTVGRQDATFNGCSGSKLGDMHGYGTGGKQLVNALSPGSTVVLMQAGGNVSYEKISFPSPGDWLTYRHRIATSET